MLADSVDLSNQCESVDRPVAGTAFGVASARLVRRRVVLRVTAPGAGLVRAGARVAGRRIRASRKVARAGRVKLTLRPSIRRRVRVSVRVTFTPRTGPAVARTLSVR